MTGWLAGLLEGEGCFSLNRPHGYPYPTVSVTMTDKDVIERVANKWGRKVHKRKLRPPYKQTWSTGLTGNSALTTVVEGFPHMGEGRMARIAEVLDTWEHHVNPKRTLRQRGE